MKKATKQEFINLLERVFSDADFDFIYQLVRNTITILNPRLKVLEEQEAAKQRQLELETYHEELPLKLLELMTEAYHLGLDYRV
jgi:hypothetical protein